MNKSGPKTDPCGSEVDTFQIIDFDMIQFVPFYKYMIETVLKHDL